MPGPVSDAYDPEFGTSANADLVRDAVTHVRDAIAREIGSPTLLNIVTLARDEQAGMHSTAVRLTLTERQLRVIRFSLNRALESL